MDHETAAFCVSRPGGVTKKHYESPSETLLTWYALALLRDLHFLWYFPRKKSSISML